MRVPPGFDAVGEEARGQVQKALRRGKCQLNLTLSARPAAPTVRINEAVLAALARRRSAG